MRRATLALAATQLVSWGVLFYGFAVVAPDVIQDTGWSPAVVAGAFSLGLLVAGVAAPGVARLLAARGPRLVLMIGSFLGVVGVLGFAAAHHVSVLYLSWAVIGLAMAATLYEPAMAVLVALDPARRQRTLAVVTVAGGLASTVFAPLGGHLAGEVGWRRALVVLALGGGAFTTLVHAFVLPPARALAVPPEPAPRALVRSTPVRRLRIALLFEQAAVMATTTHLIGLVVDRGASLALAGAALGVMGLGKVAGRLLLLGRVVGHVPLAVLAAACNAVQLAGFAAPLVGTTSSALFASAAVVGAASGVTTVLRPLLVVELVGPGPFAAVSAHLQRATTVARAGAPLAIGAGAATVGWSVTWAVALSAFGVAAIEYLQIDMPSVTGEDGRGPNGQRTTDGGDGCKFHPVDASVV